MAFAEIGVSYNYFNHYLWEIYKLQLKDYTCLHCTVMSQYNGYYEADSAHMWLKP